MPSAFGEAEQTTTAYATIASFPSASLAHATQLAVFSVLKTVGTFTLARAQ